VALGEDNRCGRCLAVASVFERTGRHVCSACGETRPRHPRTMISSEADLLQAFEPAAWTFVPVGAIGLSLAALALAACGMFSLLPGWLCGSLAVLSLAAAVFAIRAARTQRARQLGRRRYDMEQRIIGLAFGNDGMLSAAAVSSTLRITLHEAQDILGELVVTGRARAETHDETAETSYFFGEAKRTRGIRRSAAL